MSSTELTAMSADLQTALAEELAVGHLDIEVLAKHIDSLGHANNAVYVKYFERARIAFYAQLGLALESPHPPRLGTVVVNLNVNFREECVSGDQLTLVTRGQRRGNRSFVLEQRLSRKQGKLVADCIATSVIMNLDSRALEPIPDALAAALPPATPSS